MFARLGIEKRDIRNLALVMVSMTLVLFALGEGTVGVRLVVGVVGSIVSGIVFLAVTVVLNAYKPEY